MINLVERENPSLLFINIYNVTVAIITGIAIQHLKKVKVMFLYKAP